MFLESLAVGPLQVNCYIIGCEQTRQAVVVDPGEEGERIVAALAAAGLQLALIVNTHGHFDHVGGNRLLAEGTGAPIAIHQDDAPLLRRSGEHASLFGLRTVPSPEPSRLLQGG
ncbi:MAG: MBL fold metallo-hydrolase, partial [Desulfuromonadales bacterium]|nr:MBL fold metallo-hydrolase [Desulfuromonadales bacterium]